MSKTTLTGEQMFEAFANAFRKNFHEVMHPTKEDLEGLSEEAVVTAKASMCATIAAISEALADDGIGRSVEDNMVAFGMPPGMAAAFLARYVQEEDDSSYVGAH